MSEVAPFRSVLFLKLLLTFAVFATAVTLMRFWEHQLGVARLAVLAAIAGSSLYLVKVLVQTGWLDGEASPVERWVCRVLIVLQVLCFGVFLTLRLSQVFA